MIKTKKKFSLTFRRGDIDVMQYLFNFNYVISQ